VDWGGLERVLEALEDERLTPLDLRIMLRVSDDENTVPDIAAGMGYPPALIRRASRRLVARGLLRRRRRPGRPLTFALAPSDSGTSALHRVGTSLLGQAADAAPTSPVGAGRRVIVGGWLGYC
jgi:DNA-binding MarR family transcriptional regulator